MKLNKKLIEQLRNGEITAENDGTVEQLKEVIKEAFPNSSIPTGKCQYYSRLATRAGWMASSLHYEGKPSVEISDFYQTELFTGWAKDDSVPRWMVYFKDGLDKYGFDDFGNWLECSRGQYEYSNDKNDRPATHEEIEKALTKEAKRRGYKGGNTIKGIHGTLHFSEEISFHYEIEKNRLVTNEHCVVFEHGQWAEIVEQPNPKPKTNPIKYLVDGIEYSLNYQELKAEYNNVVAYSDEGFMDNLPQIAHLACVVAYFKGLGLQATISDKGIIHELIHLMAAPEEPTNDLQEIREKFNKLIQLV